MWLDCGSTFDDQVPALDVTEIAKAFPQDLIEPCRMSTEVRLEITNPWHLRWPLRFGAERRKNEAERQIDREPDQPHGHLV